ncbi:hypothetical protein [Sphingomonas sp. SUN039]|uniref:hypothetical protein n=1 Tax=Sphingomonas sp. SUN039 TaxID=2937787 RepID=UPI00216443BB|nr:hypothetical protein [Sphingomonas sp. SUN039]UVO53674.1 hypothetical protein M0209_05905 [Sphingomonas sp. SUN039]
MRKFLLWAALAAAGGSVSALATPLVPYSTAVTKIGTLLADPAAKAVIARRFPMLVKSRAVASGMANGMTLKNLKQFKPDVFTDAALAATDADFSKLPSK